MLFRSVAIIWAKLDGIIKGFLVPTDTPGFETQPIKEKWSFRTSDTAMLFLKNVQVPHTALMPGAKSLGAAMRTLNNARYGIAWGVIGAARGCLEECLEYLMNRPQFDGKPLASHQLIQNKLAWMATEITAMECLAKRLDRKSTRLNSSHVVISYAVFCLKKKKNANKSNTVIHNAPEHK